MTAIDSPALTSHRPTQRPIWYFHLMALTTCLIWSFSYIHIIWLSDHLGPAQLVGLRMDFLALGLVALWIWRRPRLRGYTVRQWALFIALGLTSGPAYHLTLAWGAAENRIEASLIGLIIATVPIHVGWIAWVTLGERLSIRRIAGLLLGLGGIVLVVRGQYGGITLWQEQLAGPIAVTAAAILGALNTVMGRGARHAINPLDLLIISGSIGAAVCLAYQPFIDMPAAGDLPWTAWWAAFYLGIPAIGVAYLTWYSAVAGLPAASVAMYLFLTSVLSAAWAWLWQDNELGWFFAAGALLVFSGLLLEALRPRRPATPPQAARPSALPAEDPA